ncbi:MAG: hypothetical protein QOJ68_251 [Blastococcus sp.]|jgi:hypothetical protein|nr:hypothetical protein [Blastococcus sp.]
MRTVRVGASAADSDFMSLEGTYVRVADGEDFGLSGHLASIERMHREALAQLNALAQPWGDLWSPPPGGATELAEEKPVDSELTVYGAHAAAA